MHSIAEFVATHADQDRHSGAFEVENRTTLQINLQDTVYAKAGAMVAYRGDVKFSRKGRWSPVLILESRPFSPRHQRKIGPNSVRSGARHAR